MHAPRTAQESPPPPATGSSGAVEAPRPPLAPGGAGGNDDAFPTPRARFLAAVSTDRHDWCARGALIGISPDGCSLRVVPLLCKRWDCPRCGPLRAAAWRRRIKAGKPTRWFTLTDNPAQGLSKRDAIQSSAKHFARLVAAIRRKYLTFSYVRVLELTKKGRPHYHVVYRGTYIHQRWLSNTWDKIHGAPIVHIGALKDTPHAVRYVSKYLTKLAGDQNAAVKGVRMITCSRDWPKDPKHNPDLAQPAEWLWTHVDHHANTILQHLFVSPLHLVSMNRRTWSVEFTGHPRLLKFIHIGLIQRGEVPPLAAYRRQRLLEDVTQPRPSRISQALLDLLHS